MAKVSTTLKNIEEMQEEEKQILTLKEQEKQLKKEYQETLENETISIIASEFEFNDNIEQVYKNLIIHDFYYKQEIEKNILSITEEKEKIILEDEFWKEKKIKISKFANLYNFNDLDNIYEKEVNKLYNYYNKKNAISNDEIKNRLIYNLDLQLKQNVNIEKFIFLLQQEDNKQQICKELTSNIDDYNFLYKNYNSILRKWYANNKSIIKAPKQQARIINQTTTSTKPQKKGNGLIGGLIGWWLGGKL